MITFSGTGSALKVEKIPDISNQQSNSEIPGSKMVFDGFFGNFQI